MAAPPEELGEELVGQAIVAPSQRKPWERRRSELPGRGKDRKELNRDVQYALLTGDRVPAGGGEECVDDDIDVAAGGSHTGDDLARQREHKTAHDAHDA